MYVTMSAFRAMARRYPRPYFTNGARPCQGSC